MMKNVTNYLEEFRSTAVTKLAYTVLMTSSVGPYSPSFKLYFFITATISLTDWREQTFSLTSIPTITPIQSGA